MLWPFIHTSPFPMLIMSRANGSFPSGASKVVCKNQPLNQLLYKNYHIFVPDSFKRNGKTKKKQHSRLAGWFSPCTKSEASLWPMMILLSISQRSFLRMKKHLKLHLLDLSAQNMHRSEIIMPTSLIIPNMMWIKKLFQLFVEWHYIWRNHSKSHRSVLFSL